MRFEQMRGAALVFPENGAHLRFYAAAEVDALDKLALSNASISFFATVVNENGTEQTTPVTLGGIDNSFETTWRTLSADTPLLTEEDYTTNYSMLFWAVYIYSDGSMQASSPRGIYCQRSAAEVASAALADTTVQYDSKIVDFLTKIASATTA